MKSFVEIVQDKCKHCFFVRDVDVLKSGLVRIGTFFLYPDGSCIDLFLKDEPPSRDYVLSDCGRTFAKLDEYQVDVDKVKLDCLTAYGVPIVGGKLEIEFVYLEELLDNMIIMSQACLSLAGMVHGR